MELTLPLAAAETLGKSDLIGIATVGSLAVSNTAPAVICKVVAECVEHRTIVNSLPQIAAAFIVPVHRGNRLHITTARIILRQFCAVVIGMILQDYVPDIHHRRSCGTTEVEHEFHL